VGSLQGSLISTGTAISITDTGGSNPLTIKQLDATAGNISVTRQGSGSLLSSGSTETIDVASGYGLTLSTQAGSIGTSSQQILTSVPTLTAVNTNSGASAYINNTDTGSGLSITNGLSSAGSLSVQTTKALTVNDLTASSISLTTGSGQLTVSPNDTVASTAGAVILQSGTNIQFGTSAIVTATGGNLSASIASAPVDACSDNGAGTGPSCRPLTVNPYVQAGSSLYWPSVRADITAPSTFYVNVQNGRTVAINASATGSIGILGGVTLNVK